MTCKFQEGETVRLTKDHPALGLKAGDTGTVWAVYSSSPTSYEVTFRDDDGMSFDMLCYEEELVPTAVLTEMIFGVSSVPTGVESA